MSSDRRIFFTKANLDTYILTVRTIAAEYLVAMKLRAGRQYKNDLSDVLGILAEHEKLGRPITIGQIRTAVRNLYNDWAALPEDARVFIENAMRDGRFEALYAEIAAGEQAARSAMIGFERQYPSAANQANINDILHSLRERQTAAQEAPQERPSVLSRLQAGIE